MVFEFVNGAYFWNMFKVRVQYISGAPTFAENLVPKQAYRIQTGAEYMPVDAPSLRFKDSINVFSSKIKLESAGSIEA